MLPLVVAISNTLADRVSCPMASDRRHNQVAKKSIVASDNQMKSLPSK